MTDVVEVSEDYPGEGKGVLEMVKNPWNESKALLLVEGSDEQGIREGDTILANDGKMINKRYIDAGTFNKVLRKIGSLVQQHALSRALDADIHVYIWFDHKPTQDEIQKFRNLRVSLDINEWIPPVGSHPYGFVPATLKVNSLYNVAELDYVIRITSMEKLHKLLEQQPNQEVIK